MKDLKAVFNSPFFIKGIVSHIILLLFLFSKLTIAQKKLVYNRFSIEDGLATSDVKSVAQDKQGFIWVGTSNGLQKYDGNKFIDPHEFRGINKLPSVGI